MQPEDISPDTVLQGMHMDIELPGLANKLVETCEMAAGPELTI